MSSKLGLMHRTAFSAAVGMAALCALAIAPAPAEAHGWKHGHGYGYYGPSYVVTRPYVYGGFYGPPPVYYAPPPAVYVPPPPVYVAPAPVYYAPPSLSFGITIPLQ